MEYVIRWPQTLSHLILVATSAGPVAAAPAAVSTDDDLRDYFGRRWPEFFVGPDKHQELFQRLRFSLSPYQAAFGRELPKYDLRPADRN